MEKETSPGISPEKEARLLRSLAYPPKGVRGMIQSAVTEDLGGKLFHVRNEPFNRLENPVLRQFFWGKGNAHPLQGMSG